MISIRLHFQNRRRGGKNKIGSVARKLLAAPLASPLGFSEASKPAPLASLTYREKTQVLWEIQRRRPESLPIRLEKDAGGSTLSARILKPSRTINKGGPLARSPARSRVPDRQSEPGGAGRRGLDFALLDGPYPQPTSFSW